MCRGWRELFTSLPSLWTRLDLTNVDKTRTYIKRSNSLPWEITIHDSGDKTYTEGALLMVVPHAKRFKSLTIGRTLDSLRDVARHLTLPVPFLQELTMDFTREPAPSFYFYVGFFNGDLSSLRTLKLAGVHTDLPWRNLRNLTTFKLRCPQNSSITATRLLDFLESTPHLKDITLEHSIPSSKASSRVVHLHNLKNLTIVADPGHAILIQHLFVPKGASLTLEFRFCRDKSPLPILLPVTTGHLENLSPITTVNLRFARTKKFVRLAGPGGAFYILGHWEQEGGAFPPLDLDRRILISLFERFYFHHTQRLTITKYEVPTPNDVKEFPLYLILLRMLNLHTLQLILCNNPPFILALNPDCNPSRSVVCPNLEELILYIKARGAFNIPELTSMAKGRGSKDAKLRSMKILGLGEPLPGKEVFQLQEHVTHVEYRFKVGLPKWDNIPEYPTGALEPDQVQSSQAYRFAQGEAKDALTVEQKRRLTEGIKTLNGQELERAKQIILGGVPGLRNVYRASFFRSTPVADQSRTFPSVCRSPRRLRSRWTGFLQTSWLTFTISSFDRSTLPNPHWLTPGKPRRRVT